MQLSLSINSGLIDTHCHLDFDVFDKDRQQILHSCWQQGISAIVIPATQQRGWEKICHLCHQPPQSADNTPRLYAALGLHPYYLKEHRPEHIQQLAHWCRQGRVKILGETGLDYYLKNLDKKQQRYWFLEQLKLAQSYHLPVIIHARKSLHDIEQMLRDYPDVKGIIHAYNGSLEQAAFFIQRGFKLGFGGAFCHPAAKKLRRLAALLPLNSLVLETDAPDMLPCFAPANSINTPLHLVRIFEHLSELRSEPASVVADALRQNSRVLGID